MENSLYHEYCLLFPQATDDVLEDMANDIKKYGLNEPIIMYKGQILDGRNRYLACKKAGVEPTFKEYTGEEPLTFVVSKNLMRRQLTPSQRALAGYKAYKLLLENEGVDPKQAKELIAQRFAITSALLDDVDRVEEFAVPSVKADMHSLDMTVTGAASVVREAAANAGINLNRKKNWDALSYEQQVRIAQAQNDVLEHGVSSEVYAPIELEQVYKRTGFQRVLHEIEQIVASMATLPTLYNEAKDYMGALEEEKLMVVVGNMMINEANKVLLKLYDEALSYDDILGLAAQMLNMRFKIPDLSELKESQKVDLAQDKIKEGCESLIKSIRRIKRQLSRPGTQLGEDASAKIMGDN